VLTTAISGNIIYNYIILTTDPVWQALLLMLWRIWLPPGKGFKMMLKIYSGSPMGSCEHRWEDAQCAPK
jgi:hypothetical protein